MHKHYIRLNNKNHIIKGFSTAFEQPIGNDILIEETKERHYNPAIILTHALQDVFLYG